MQRQSKKTKTITPQAKHRHKDPCALTRSSTSRIPCKILAIRRNTAETRVYAHRTPNVSCTHWDCCHILDSAFQLLFRPRSLLCVKLGMPQSSLPHEYYCICFMAPRHTETCPYPINPIVVRRCSRRLTQLSLEGSGSSNTQVWFLHVKGGIGIAFKSFLLSGQGRAVFAKE